MYRYYPRSFHCTSLTFIAIWSLTSSDSSHIILTVDIQTHTVILYKPHLLQIPVFPCLMRNGDLAVALGGSHAAAAASMVGGGNSDRPSTASNGNSSSGETSLLDWINSKGGGGSLEQVCNVQCATTPSLGNVTSSRKERKRICGTIN